MVKWVSGINAPDALQHGSNKQLLPDRTPARRLDAVLKLPSIVRPSLGRRPGYGSIRSAFEPTGGFLTTGQSSGPGS